MSNQVLLIAPLFFDYYKSIIEELKSLGYEVDYVCDAPSNSNISKAIGRIDKNLIKKSTEKYFSNLVWPTISDKKYQKVLVVGGMTFAFTPGMVEKIRKNNPDADFILYQWDSERNLPYSTGIHKYFNRIYSFDMNDCAAKDFYNFLPLFYTKEYGEIGEKKVSQYEYDCSYVGTAHPLKFKGINEMAMALKDVMPKQYIYHYMPSKLKFIYHKVLAKEFRNAKLSDFENVKKSKSELLELFTNSYCIFDAPQAGQTGLTIRTIECLGACRKLVTTNADITKYDFYDERNILIYDGNIDFDSAFFKEPYVALEKNIYDKYSLKSWLQYMLV